MSSMAPSQPIKRKGIGGESRQHAGAEQDEQKVEHGRVSKMEPWDAPSGHQDSIRILGIGHKDFIVLPATSTAILSASVCAIRRHWLIDTTCPVCSERRLRLRFRYQCNDPDLGDTQSVALQYGEREAVCRHLLSDIGDDLGCVDHDAGHGIRMGIRQRPV